MIVHELLHLLKEFAGTAVDILTSAIELSDLLLEQLILRLRVHVKTLSAVNRDIVSVQFGQL